jgi:hypothetical protein
MASQEVSNFIRGSFRSVWSLELLLFLRGSPERAWTTAELVAGLRASESIVEQSVHTLVAGGLVATDANGAARYSPAAPDLEQLVIQTEAFYAKKPDAVRRLIVMAAHDGLAAFADAFKLRRD